MKTVVRITADELIPSFHQIDETKLNERGLREEFVGGDSGEYEYSEKDGKRVHIFYFEAGYSYDATFIIE